MKVFIEFSGQTGSGKSVLSRTIRNHLANLGLKIEDLGKEPSDTLKVTTSLSTLRRLAKRFNNV